MESEDLRVGYSLIKDMVNGFSIEIWSEHGQVHYIAKKHLNKLLALRRSRRDYLKAFLDYCGDSKYTEGYTLIQVNNQDRVIDLVPLELGVYFLDHWSSKHKHPEKRTELKRLADSLADKYVIGQENSLPSSINSFNPEDIEDQRIWDNKRTIHRPEQRKFRQQLLKAYGRRCAITGCYVKEVLEAAHIYPHKGGKTDLVNNGLLLRGDIHTLFDLHLLTVHPETKEIEIAPQLKGTNYSQYYGKKLQLPQDRTLYPREELLKWHYDKFVLTNQGKA